MALPWRVLLRFYHRLEARGDIRGGRFVAGISGEQFALPEAIGMLRAIRRAGAQESLISVSAADPLNLVGIIVPGSRITAHTSNRILYQDGAPIAALESGETRFLVELSRTMEWKAKAALMRKATRPELRSYLHVPPESSYLLSVNYTPNRIESCLEVPLNGANACYLEAWQLPSIRAGEVKRTHETSLLD